MPGDQADEIGAPNLCPHHQAVIRDLAAKDHVDDRDSTRVAVENRQCCQTRRNP